MKNPETDLETKNEGKKQSHFITRMRHISTASERSEKWTFILLTGILLGALLGVAYFVFV